MKRPPGCDDLVRYVPPCVYNNVSELDFRLCGDTMNDDVARVYLVKRNQRFAQIASLLVLTLGLLVMVGWVFNIPVFKSVLPGLVTMKFNTAMAFCCSGIALLTRRTHPRLSWGLAVFVTGLALLTLSQYVFDLDLRIDQWLFQDTTTASFPGRMAPVTALNFCLLGSALLAMHRQWYYLSQGCSVVAMLLALLAVAGYLYGVESLYRISTFSSMAVHTALGFIFAGGGLLRAEPENGFIRIVTASGAGGTLIRRLIPAVLILPILTGWLCLQGQRLSFYDIPFGVALFALSNLVIVAGLIMRLAWVLHRVDVARETAVAALRQSHEDLENKVLERTAALGEITRRLEAERNLLRTLIDTSPDYIFIKDAGGRFIISNMAHTQAAQVTPDELAGKTAFDLFTPDLAAQFHADDIQVIQSGEPLINLKRSTTDPQGQPRTVLTTKIPLRNPEGQITGLVGISRDITDHQQLEVQRHQLDLEREKVRLLNDFMMAASHDLRTPLTVMRTSLDLLKRLTDPAKQAQRMIRLEEALNQLYHIIEDLFTLVRLDMTAADFVLKPGDVNVLVDMVCQDNHERATRHRHTLHLKLNNALPGVLLNPIEFVPALRQMVTNAIHYTPDGGDIHVETAVENHHVVVSVRDTGIGIRPEDLPRLFDRFFRVDKARNIETGGSGLGLTIAQKIVEAHGGQIQVESTPGVGSVFRILLPIPAASELPTQ